MPERAHETARDLARAEIRRRILAAAREQLRSSGPGELSVRAVAREVGMVSSAVYRYFANRDALLTALLLDVYEELAEELERAERRELRRATGTDPRGWAVTRFVALAEAMRRWALRHPQDWALLYGSPVPGYEAPQDTVSAATRTTGAFVRVLRDLDASIGRGEGRADDPAAAAVAGYAATVELDPGRLLEGVAAWTTVMGAVSLEVFGHYRNVVADPAALLTHLARREARRLVGREVPSSLDDENLDKP